MNRAFDLKVSCPECGEPIEAAVLLTTTHYRQAGGGKVTAVSVRGPKKGSRLAAFHKCPTVEEIHE